MPSNLLSKSKYMNGLQCLKYLWILFHEPEKIPEPDKATKFKFDQGHLVGELAKKLFPDGIDIPTGDFIKIWGFWLFSQIGIDETIASTNKLAVIARKIYTGEKSNARYR